jgi:hypothetical protein
MTRVDETPAALDALPSEWHKGYRSGWTQARERLDPDTSGTWSTEVEAETAFDEATSARPDLWQAYRQVPGTLIHPRRAQIDKSMRIDRILVPKQGLIDAGWTHGVFGVEIKRSGESLGKPIAQALDYLRSVWTLPNNFHVWLDWVFIWPMPATSGALASICAQQRIGSARPGWSDARSIELHCGPTTMLRVANGEIKVGNPRNGRKSGSR